MSILAQWADFADVFVSKVVAAQLSETPIRFTGARLNFKTGAKLLHAIFAATGKM